MTVADPVEIKINIGGDIARTLELLGLAQDVAARTIWFLDDLTDGARPALPLSSAGIILRLRSRKNGKEDLTVKLRPCRRSQLVGDWTAARPDDSPEFRIEADWSRQRRTLAASCEGALATGTVAAAIVGSDLGAAFADEQLRFLSECGDMRVNPAGLTALGPIISTQWKDLSINGFEGVVAERWIAGGLDFLELSTRADTSSAEVRQASFTAAVTAAGLPIDANEDPKTRRVLERLAGMA